MKILGFIIISLFIPLLFGIINEDSFFVGFLVGVLFDILFGLLIGGFYLITH